MTGWRWRDANIGCSFLHLNWSTVIDAYTRRNVVSYGIHYRGVRAHANVMHQIKEGRARTYTKHFSMLCDIRMSIDSRVSTLKVNLIQPYTLKILWLNHKNKIICWLWQYRIYHFWLRIYFYNFFIIDWIEHFD